MLKITLVPTTGLNGVVFCIDASPDAFPAALETWLQEAGATDSGKLQDAIIHHMYELMSGRTSKQLTEKLNAVSTWKDKVEACFSELRGRVAHSSQYAKALLQAAYVRIGQARKYNAESLRKSPLRSQLVLLRSSSQLPTLDYDLGLSSYSIKTPIVYQLSLDHARAADDLRCSNIINRHLDKSIWESFKKRNLCETYLLNATTFMDESKNVDDVKITD